MSESWLRRRPATERMEEEIERRLLALNRSFYERLALPFAQTRERAQPGFARLLEYMPQPCSRVLDVGCGEGRFGRFLSARGFTGSYLGLDFSEALLVRAATALPETFDSAFLVRDLAGHAALSGLGGFDLIVCLAVLQHIPGRENRVRLMREMAQHLAPGGHVFLSTWQFMDSERQRRKLVRWQDAGLDPERMEPGDHLLSWQSGGYGYRYVAHIDATETHRLVSTAGLGMVAQFRSDGREGNLNLYTVMAKR
jgi:tRNA (uracil-5-)-methyltransferase TRM9